MMMSLSVKDSDLNRRGRLVLVTLPAEVPDGADGQGLALGNLCGREESWKRYRTGAILGPTSPLPLLRWL